MPIDVDFTNALVITGGGTGGHFFPALALAEGARTRWKDLPIAFVGAQRGIEGRKLPGSGWPHVLLDVSGIVGRSPIEMSRSLWKLLIARRKLVRLWKVQRPIAVIGTGGYGAGPALLAARRLGIPYFMHESNATPGQLVRSLAKGARRIWCGMGEVADQLKGADCIQVGTPVREGFLRQFSPLDRLVPPFRLLVLGGSGGAKPINEALFSLAPNLLDGFPEWEIHHQAGPMEFDRLHERARHQRHFLYPFMEKMDEVMERASLIISRSGASTCAELSACGRPAIFVPFPGAAGDHQTRNAQAMVGQGRGLLVPQRGDLEIELGANVRRLMGSSDARESLSRAEENHAVTRCLDDLSECVGSAADSGLN
jgi:UDP-N-acetylglucosamine--N-acetylmuramyl-(pentapeptide) pyrophosphoryl-undecaprenol N-acetylglucosamine transferase